MRLDSPTTRRSKATALFPTSPTGTRPVPPHLLAFLRRRPSSDAAVLNLGEEGQYQYAFEQSVTEHLSLILSERNDATVRLRPIAPTTGGSFGVVVIVGTSRTSKRESD
jgi:hypothetical protein